MSVPLHYLRKIQELKGQLPFGKIVPLDESDLATIEAELGCQLPEEYREFLQYFGGIRFPYGVLFCYEAPPPITVSEIEHFYGFSPEDSRYHLLVRNRTYHGSQSPRMIPQLLPIASDGMGEICLLMASTPEGKNEGEIVYWDRVDETDPPDESNVYFIAGDFEEFFGSLQLREEH